jgi:hypothetical protein
MLRNGRSYGACCTVAAIPGAKSTSHQRTAQDVAFCDVSPPRSLRVCARNSYRQWHTTGAIRTRREIRWQEAEVRATTRSSGFCGGVSGKRYTVRGLGRDRPARSIVRVARHPTGTAASVNQMCATTNHRSTRLYPSSVSQRMGLQASSAATLNHRDAGAQLEEPSLFNFKP